MSGTRHGWVARQARAAISIGMILATSLGAAELARASDEPASADGPAGPVRVALDEYTIVVEPGQVAAGHVRLKLENVGQRRHNLVVLVDGAEVESPYLRPGETTLWDVPIERPGAFRYWCGEYRHLEKGMEGTLVVE